MAYFGETLRVSPKKQDIARFVSCFFLSENSKLIMKGGHREMNQQKIGTFLKQLRNEQNLTQEQLAEQLNVSRRTVSRWETGRNLPDLDILIEMSDYYSVELLELLNGERKSEKMNEELEKTVLKVAELSSEEKLAMTRRIHLVYLGGLIAAIVYFVLLFTDHADNFVGGFCLGILLGLMIFGVIITSKYAMKIRAFKMRALQGKF